MTNFRYDVEMTQEVIDGRTIVRFIHHYREYPAEHFVQQAVKAAHHRLMLRAVNQIERGRVTPGLIVVSGLGVQPMSKHVSVLPFLTRISRGESL